MIQPNQPQPITQLTHNKTNSKSAAKTNWRAWLQGAWIVQVLPFLLFLAALAVLYIGNGHYADKHVRSTEKASRELKQLQYHYKTLQGELIYRSKESELSKAVAPLGLAKSPDPPVLVVENTSSPQIATPSKK